MPSKVNERKIASVVLVNSCRQSYKRFFYNPIARQQWSTIATCPGKLRTLNLPLKNEKLEMWQIEIETHHVYYKHILFTNTP